MNPAAADPDHTFPPVRQWIAARWASPRLRRLIVGLVLVGVLSPASQARANVTLPDLEDEVMCVVCKRPLSTSGGSAAEDERAVIQKLVDRGLTKQQIKNQLVAEYGEQVLVKDGSPVAAAAPVIAAVVGAGSITLLLRRRRAARGDEPATDPAAAATGPAPDPSAADDARIDAELAERG